MIFIFQSCRYPHYTIQQTQDSRIAITDSLRADSTYNQLIMPYKKSMDSLLDRYLAYSPIQLDMEGTNTVLGNFVTDMMLFEANKIYAQNHRGQKIDVVLMNRGGLRRTFAPGNLTVRSMYELMPFENEAVVVTMSGKKLFEMVTFLRKSERNHPVAGLEFNKNSEDKDFLVNGKIFDENSTYTVLTNDYLQKGGDQMRFFLDPINVEYLNIKLRDMFIQHLEKVDTVRVDLRKRYLE